MNTDNRCHINDRATALTHHNGHTGMNEVERRLQVYGNHGIPLLFCHAEHEPIFGDTGIVDQNVDAAKLFLHFVYDLLCFGKVGRI